MTPGRAAAYIGVSALLVAWLASAASVTPSVKPSRPPSASPELAVLDAIAADVQSQASRLRSRLREAPGPRAPLRNPFRFAGRATPPREARPIAASSADDAPALPESPPPLVLLGVAEQHSGTTILRTAMIDFGSELLMVVEGESILGRYTVVAVGPDSVDLLEPLTGRTFRLALRDHLAALPAL